MSDTAPPTEPPASDTASPPSGDVKYRIKHATTYRYEEPVAIALNRVTSCFQPISRLR